MKFKLSHLVLPLILLVVLGFGTWRLSESPIIWGDEGMLIELAVNRVRHGEMKTQLAPNEYVSAALMTTGFPVIYPVAASLKLFGLGLLQARSVMVIFMLLCIAAVFTFAKRMWGVKIAALSALLVATLPPFYGNGKNVLGEIPGLFFLFSFLLCVHALETAEKRRRELFLLCGLIAGLIFVTKPIFLMILPAILGGMILARKQPFRKASEPLLAILGFILPLVFWLKTQFLPGDSVKDIFSFYANPYQLTDIPAAIRENILRFFSETAAIYLLGIFVIWSLSFLPRAWKKEVTLAEAISYAFSGIVIAAYLRTPGWHRYFFPAQIVALVYLPASLEYLAGKIKRLPPVIKFAPALGLSALILLQAYQVAFDSWIATTYPSVITRDLKAYLKNFDPKKSVFTPPELIVFLPTDNYYQHLDINGFKFGEAQLKKLEQGVPDVLVIYKDDWDSWGKQKYPLYEEKIRIARYLFAERKSGE